MEGHTPEIHNIFKPGHGGDGGGNGLAAALPFLATRHGHHDGLGGIGTGLVGGIIGGLLFGRGGRGGLFGGDDGGNGGAETRIEDSVYNTAVLTKLGSIEAAIPLASARTENVILTQTNQITNLASQAQLANAAGFAATKDAVQTVGTVLLQGLNSVNQNVSEQACSVKSAVVSEGEKTRAMLAARFQLEDATRINELNAKVIELQSEGRRSADNAELRLQITNTNTAVAAQSQGQQQQQFQTMAAQLASLVPAVAGLIQVAHATNSNIIAGNAGAVLTGAQTANPVNVAG